MMAIDDALGWTSLALSLIGFVSLLLASARRPRGRRIRCPGPPPNLPPRLRFIAWLDPRLAFIRGRCWYNLTGLSEDDCHCLRCPECGTKTRRSQLFIDAGRIRYGVIGGVAMLLAVIAFVPPWIRGGSWTCSIPTLALAVIQHASPSKPSTPIGHEVDRRVNAGGVSGWSASILADAIVRDLRDDSIHWNADRAIDLLSQMGPESTPALERALRAGDPQARVLAAGILRSRNDPPSDDLLWACVEDLRDDSRTIARYLSFGNASAAADYLIMHADQAKPHLIKALSSDSGQQRLLSAAVIGHAAMLDLAETAAPILIDHLRDNNIRGDAKVAAPALYAFGDAVLPLLRPHIDSQDPQLRAAARSIIERIEHPRRSLYRLNNPMPRITETTNDPLSSVSFDESARDLRMRD